MRARPVEEWPSGKMSPETFGHGVYAFRRSWRVQEEMADNSKAMTKSLKSKLNSLCKTEYKASFLDCIW